MTLNWLKDIGVQNYCKPDMHICRIITGIYKEEFLAKGKPYVNTKIDDWYKLLPSNKKVQKDVFVKATEQAELDEVDLFAFDRLLFLIGSGDFYLNDNLSKQIKSEYATKLCGKNLDDLFVKYVLNSN